MLLNDIVVVLSRTQDSGNIGAACRALKNSGLSWLRLVNPDPVDEEVVRIRAIHAVDVWEHARYFDTLKDATADCPLVVGTTRRRGSKRKSVSMDPAQVAAFFRNHPGRAAVVFGNERTGLDAEELNLCNIASHIPADNAFPSLNLSHAVQIYGYELFRALSSAGPEPGHWIPLDPDIRAGFVRRITDSLELLGFYTQPGREEQERFLNDLFARSGLSLSEASYLRDIFVKAAHLSIKKSGTVIVPDSSQL
ncbi:RNA methyltransferase [Spirochaetia bacterium]|nr:RNA methyltransferase [Spirochaetia bacterium]GHU33612.1 RNA methyltransferase [Spirochaetia bacterium]